MGIEINGARIKGFKPVPPVLSAGRELIAPSLEVTFTMDLGDAAKHLARFARAFGGQALINLDIGITTEQLELLELRKRTPE